MKYRWMRRLIPVALLLGLLFSGCAAEKPKSEYATLQSCVEQIRRRTAVVPEVAVVLGSGLGSLSEMMQVEAQISYGEIRGLPVSTAEGHAGKFLFGTIDGVPAVVMQGRVHYYEGYSAQEVVRPIRVMGLLGAKRLILLNSSGAVNPELGAGDLMLIRDHILFNVPSPLIGENPEELGERFPDMKTVYDRELSESIRAAAAAEGIPLKEGVYLQDSGPNYETPAEAGMFRTLGADAVGMSTACEAVAAHHMGMRVCGISCVTCAPADAEEEPISDEAVQSLAAQRTGQLKALVLGAVHAAGE